MDHLVKHAIAFLLAITASGSQAQVAAEAPPPAPREWLAITAISLADGTLVPMGATVKELQHVLGKGAKAKPAERPACGTWYESGPLRYLDYPFLRLEMGPAGAAEWIGIFPTGADITIHTSKGPLNANTALEEFKGWFHDLEPYSYTDAEEGTWTFTIPEGIELDSAVRLLFTTGGKLISIEHFIPC